MSRVARTSTAAADAHPRRPTDAHPTSAVLTKPDVSRGSLSSTGKGPPDRGRPQRVAIARDAVSHVPSDTAKASERARRASAVRMLEIAELCQDREAASILRAGAAALLRGALPPWMEKPSWEGCDDIAECPPVALEGRLERKIRGGDARQRAHLLFRPDSAEVQPFPIPQELVEGFPQGARLTVGVERGALGEKIYRIVASATERARSMVADIVVEDGVPYAVGRGLLAPYHRLPLSGPLARQFAGNAIVAEIRHPDRPTRKADITEFLGRSEGPKATFLQAATEAGADLEFPSDVRKEIARLERSPGIRGRDLTALPFVTIDNEDSKDLDQAICIQRDPKGGYWVHYAIADASHFVKRGSAIDREARRRSLTTFLPDRSIPMLPPELSEDLCSLVPGKKRRAIVVSVKLDENGVVEDTSFQRGVIRSRAKLSFDQVQRFHDDERNERDLRGTDFTESLELLARVGDLRREIAKARNVFSSSEGEPRIHPHELAPSGFLIKERDRNQVELWNEQISVMVNEEVAKFLSRSGARTLYRVHMPPDREAEDAFRSKVRALGLPWEDDVELRAYMESLDPADPRTKAIHRLATRIHRKAKYSLEPLGHAALKLGPYVHFTAPMRRYVDIRAVHDVLVALIEGKRPPKLDDREVAEIVARNEAAERRDQAVMARCHSYMLAYVLRDSMFNPTAGTIVEVTSSGALVELEHPRVVIPMSTQAMRSLGGGHFTADPNGVELKSRKMTLRCGDVLPVTVVWADPNSGMVDAVPSELLAPKRAWHRPVVVEERMAPHV